MKQKNGNFHVVYLTGAPATGKSTLSAHLKARNGIRAFIYGEELTKHLQGRGRKGLTQTELRKKSSRIATPADIDAVDKLLFKFAVLERKGAHVLVDSHAVTKEQYGFRVTGFSSEGLRKLRPTMIFVLYADSSVIRSRIRRSSGGRPMVSTQEADMHSTLQASVAISYATQLGIPAYFLDADRPTEILAGEILRRLEN